MSDLPLSKYVHSISHVLFKQSDNNVLTLVSWAAAFIHKQALEVKFVILRWSTDMLLHPNVELQGCVLDWNIQLFDWHCSRQLSGPICTEVYFSVRGFVSLDKLQHKVRLWFQSIIRLSSVSSKYIITENINHVLHSNCVVLELYWWLIAL